MSPIDPTIERTGLGVTHRTWSDAKAAILTSIESSAPSQVVTLTPEMCVRADSDPVFSDIIRNAAIVVADGIGIVWGETKLTGKHVDKIPGIDLASWAIGEIDKIGGKIYLLGSKPDVVEKAVDFIKEKYPGIESIGFHDGYFKSGDEGNVVSEIATFAPHLLLVGMGSPRQENFIAKNLVDLNCSVAIGVGGSFDVWSGKIKRAPSIFRKTGTEWLFRTITQPSSRIGRIPLLWKFTGLVLSKRSRR